MMGSDQKEKDWALARGYSPIVIRNEGENPRRTKIANGFWLGRTEVTIGQWKKFAEASGYLSEAEKAGWAYAFDRGTGKRGRAEGASWRNPNFGFGIKDDHPVCCISWNDAVAFCEWLTETEKKANRLPVGMVCRLPTEAEWEYACRAGTHTMFWWGDERQDGDERVNMRGTQDGFEFVSPVDHFRSRGRNKFGLADMLGNLWELCLDDYDAEQPHEEYYKNSLPRRVERGGSFSAGANWRCAVRQGVLADNTDCTNGFRVCCGAPR
jgi:formylglycine-generating enzyme required for sulfatase activity